MRRQIARGATDPLRASIWLAFLLAGAVLASIAEGQTAAGTAGGHARAYDVRTYGAKGDGRTIDTRSIQEAIRAAHAVGGGRVIFPPGTYVSGTIELLSNVTLELEAGSLLLGSSNLADYGSISQYGFAHEYGKNSTGEGERVGIIVARNVENIAIVGQGAIDGNADIF